jgi:hypothetical protein
MCQRRLYAQCETTQNKQLGKGASLFGYTKLYGHVPGGQAEYLRVPQAQFGPIKVPEGPPDDRFVYLSDILPTAWQAARYADVPEAPTRWAPRTWPVTTCPLSRRRSATRNSSRRPMAARRSSSSPAAYRDFGVGAGCLGGGPHR